MTNETGLPTIRRLRRTLLCAVAAVGLGAFAASPGAAQQNGAGAEQDQRIDNTLDALDDPLLRRMATRVPETRRGPRGAQPFDQEPPAAQGDFTRPETNTGGGQQSP